MLGSDAGNLPDAVELEHAGPCLSDAGCRLLRVPDREDIRRVYLGRAFSGDWRGEETDLSYISHSVFTVLKLIRTSRHTHPAHQE